MRFPKLKSKTILAPMEDVTNIPFRILCQRYGAGITYTQQLSAIALLRENKKSLELIKRSRDENLVGLQLFGRDPETLLKAAEKYGKNFDAIDLNFGCPSKKIVEQGYGSALLKEKNKIFEIVNTLAKNLDKPVTVKMRSGFKKVEALELIKEIERAGATAVTLHARTKEQGYSGKSDWELIRKVKEIVKIPIIGNGDVVSLDGAREKAEQTKCDGVMIGKGIFGNPWLFGERSLKEVSVPERLRVMCEHASLFEEMFKNIKNFSMMKKHFKSYVNEFEGAKELRMELMETKQSGEVGEIVERFLSTKR